MSATKAKTAGKEMPRIGRALVWSASAHLLAVSCLFLLGAGSMAGPRLVTVDVFLVEAPGRTRAAAKPTGSPSPGRGIAPVSGFSPGERDFIRRSLSPPPGPETVEEEVMRPGKEDAPVGSVGPGNSARFRGRVGIARPR